jgi:opacity protein-like surface antigen
MRPIKARLGRTALLVMLIACLAAAPAAAQDVIPATPSPATESIRRPYRGLFAPEGRPGVPTLDFLFSAFTAYDEDVFAAEEGGSIAPQARESGWFSGVSGGFTFHRPGDKVVIGALGGVSVNRYQARSATAVITKLAGDVGVNFTPRSRGRLASTVSYSPDYRVSFFSSAEEVANEDGATLLPDFYLTSLASVHVDGSAGFTHDFSSRTSFIADASASTTEYLDQPYSVGQYGASARITQRLTRSLGLRLGYGYGVGTYSMPERSEYAIHTIDAGIDFQRDLSISRRTQLAFSTGSAVLVSDPASVAVPVAIAPGAELLGPDPASSLLAPGPASSLVDLPQEINYFLTGEARLIHEIYRTWRALGIYRRGVGFDEGLRQPTISQSASARLVGLLSRRVKFSAGADYSFGTIGVNTDQGFEAVTANAGVTYALSRRMAAFARYVYYSYSFDGLAGPLEPTLPTALDRQGIRIGLTLSVPVLR